MIQTVYKKGGRPTKRPKDKEAIAEFFELYATHTATELGVMYGVPASTVRSWASQLRKECGK